LPPCRPTTAEATSSALVKNAPVWTMTSRSSVVSAPAISCRLAGRGPEDVADSQPRARETGRVEMEPHLSAVAADERGLRDLRKCLISAFDLGSDPPQGQMVVASRVEGQREDGHIVDRPRLTSGRGGPGRDAIGVPCSFGELDQRPLGILATR